ncbi:cysteine-rich receptor-like protein kinase 2 [Heracleum sosnowskyi]|uniref:Cysteine-rich receptor-like protein kinase 2 n=1 Tax=Heracleum sosnowskyi TaxID=360622 RepID=A0AAD8JEA3_9APIA|nr:cysteine-rich receptor-like protein kinase 2 [Heracleum sosnowskyi]
MKDVFLWSLCLIAFASLIKAVISDPQTTLLDQDCSPSISTDVSGYLSNRNKTFKDLRGQLLKNNTKFATAQKFGVYALAQCRDYLSGADCLACFVAAVSLSLNCLSDGTARVIFEGCYLRYEAEDFYRVATLPGDTWKCSPNQSSIKETLIDPVVKGLLMDLEAATPKTNGLFAAATQRVHGAGTDATIYAVAQCARTVSPSVCSKCLSVANRNVQHCPPQAGGSSVDAGCFLRYSDTAFFPKNAITDITPFLRVSSRTKSIISVCIVGGVCVFLLILALILWHRLFRKTAKRGVIAGLTNYNYKDLKSATKSFSEKYKVGEGGFGDVYKGIMKNGHVVAVKKLATSTSKVKADFESEIRLTSEVNHRNIIRLLGCCRKGPELLLVFEYMENGSLDKFLYGENRGTLGWKQRFDIIFGVARGLAYLHEEFHISIIHRDIKSSNILLDVDYQPKIADFGLARFIAENQSHFTTGFAGTLGYTAPEYAIHGHLSEKVDTYAYGVVVLEIISGRQSTNKMSASLTDPLLAHAWKLYADDLHLKLVDETLDPGEYNTEIVKKIIQLALMCTQSPTSTRPTMSEVVVSLKNISPIEHISQSNPTWSSC